MTGTLNLLLGGGGVSAYQISRSLRFNPADSPYLIRTPSSTGNRKTFTYSAWVKLNLINQGASNHNCLFYAGTFGGRPSFDFNIINNQDLILNVYDGGGYNAYVQWAPRFRDPGAWYHFMLVVDTTQATNTNRIKAYVNGVQLTTTGTPTWPSQNFDFDVNLASTPYNVGTFYWSGQPYLGANFAEFYWIDGQALTPSSFGETNATTGVWQPKAYTGTYGTNGSYLNFSDNSGTTSTTLGKDYSGNGNNWTPNNFSVTAGAGNDSLVDTPTPYGADTGAGGEVRGNYCTMNPLNATGATPVNGNLDVTLTSPGSTIAQIRGTIAPSTGKWYWENVITSDGNQSTWFGVVAASTAQNANLSSGQSVNQVIYSRYDGTKIVNGTSSSYGSSYTTGDVIGVALDLDGGTVTFYKNNTSQGSISLPTTGIPYAPVYWWSSSTSSGASTFNFGQRAFAYTAPSGYKALCTQNLSTPTVVQGDDYFNTVLWSGNGSTQSITGVGFQPDLVWYKGRTNAYNHRWFDVIRGATNAISSNLTDAESSVSGVTAFNSDGFSLGSDVGGNNSGQTYVAWNWKANGAGSSNTAGSITSTVSANTTAGFSIVTYTGTGANATVGHGLGAVPSMIIIKIRSSSSYGWLVGHVGLTNQTTYYVDLNGTGAESSNSTVWNSTAPTSSVISLGTNVVVNTSSATYVAYCFAAIPGYSAFGRYTGNGTSGDGPFVYLGFRPAWLLIKMISSSNDWVLFDSKRNTYNTIDDWLYPNLANSEQTNDPYNNIDFVSNGFKIRGLPGTYTNSSGATYIYAAFAENPFKYALAR